MTARNGNRKKTATLNIIFILEMIIYSTSQKHLKWIMAELFQRLFLGFNLIISKIEMFDHS